MRNRWNAHVKHFRQVAQRVSSALIRWSLRLLVQRSDFSNFCIRELSRSSQTFRNEKPSVFRERIPLIIGVRSKEQVIGAHAWRIVAAMKNAKVFWNRAEMQIPRESMGKKKSRFLRTCQLSVSAAIDGTSPEPTRFRFLDSAPETFGKSFVHARPEGGRF